MNIFTVLLIFLFLLLGELISRSCEKSDFGKTGSFIIGITISSIVLAGLYMYSQSLQSITLNIYLAVIPLLIGIKCSYPNLK